MNETKSETANVVELVKMLRSLTHAMLVVTESKLDYIDEKGLDEFRDENLKNDKNLGD